VHCKTVAVRITDCARSGGFVVVAEPEVCAARQESEMPSPSDQGGGRPKGYCVVPAPMLNLRSHNRYRLKTPNFLPATSVSIGKLRNVN